MHFFCWEIKKHHYFWIAAAAEKKKQLNLGFDTNIDILLDLTQGSFPVEVSKKWNEKNCTSFTVSPVIDYCQNHKMLAKVEVFIITILIHRMLRNLKCQQDIILFLRSPVNATALMISQWKKIHASGETGDCHVLACPSLYRLINSPLIHPLMSFVHSSHCVYGDTWPSCSQVLQLTFPPAGTCYSIPLV